MTHKFIFISYSHEDAEKVQKPIEMLSRNHDTWIDQGQSTGELTPEITFAIENCICFVAFTSSNYFASSYCSSALSYAQNHLNNISLIVISLETEDVEDAINRLDDNLNANNVQCEKAMTKAASQRKRRELLSPPTTPEISYELAYDLASIFLHTIIEYCPKHHILLHQQIKHIFSLYQTEEIGYIYARSLFSPFQDDSVVINEDYINEFKEVYDSLHTKYIGNLLANAIYLFISQDNVSIEDINGYIDQIRDIHNEFHTEESADMLSSALIYLSSNNSLDVKFLCVEEIKNLYGEHDTIEIGDNLSKAIFNVAFDLSLSYDQTLDHIHHLRLLYDKQHSPVTELILANAYYNLSIHIDTSPQQAHFFVDQIMDLYHRSHLEDTGMLLAKALFSLAVDNSLEVVMECKERLQSLFKELRIVEIATELSRTLLKLGSLTEENHIQEINDLYNEFPIQEIADCLAIALYNHSIEDSSDEKEECLEKLRHLYNQTPTENVSCMLAKALYNQLFNDKPMPTILNGYIDEIRSIYHAHPHSDIGAILANSLYILTEFNPSIPVKESCVKEIERLYYDHSSNSITIAYAKAINNLIFTPDLSLEKRYEYTLQLQDIWIKLESEDNDET